MNINVLLTGDIQVGKTTVCRGVVELARRWGYKPKGLLTPPILDEDGAKVASCLPYKCTKNLSVRQGRQLAKVGIELVDIDSGERRLLARANHDLGGPQVGRYSFDAKALAWGQSILDKAIRVGCDLLVVDEVGYLELERKEGFNAVLEALRAGALPRIIIVVRSSLVESLRQLLPRVDFVTFTVTEENRDALPLKIAERIFDDRGG